MLDQLIAGQKYTREKKEIENFMPEVRHLQQNLDYLRITRIAVQHVLPTLNADDRARATESLMEATAEITKLEMVLGSAS